MDSLLNLNNYTPLEYVLYGLGGGCWVITYLIILFQARKREFVGAPALVMWAYMSWEILWGFVYQTDLGTAFEWGLKAYLPLSGYICWLTLRYGYKQYQSGLIQHYQVVAFVFTLVAWTAFLYFFIPALDDGGGMTTAAFLGVTMSATYLPLLVRLFEKEGTKGLEKLSYAVAWFKMLATVFTTLFCLVHLPERRWLHVIGISTIVMDAVYCYAFYRMKTSAVVPLMLRRTQPRTLVQAQGQGQAQVQGQVALSGS